MTLGTQTMTIDVPSSEWLTANGRLHWAEKARRTRALRTRAAFTARNQHTQPVSIAHVTAHIQYPTTGRADPGNASPTVKACLDGLTDAGVWEDDSSEYLIGPDYRRDTGKARKGWHRVRLVIVEQEVDF